MVDPAIGIYIDNVYIPRATNALFESCASGAARYFKSPSGEQLELAFTTIANDLSTLRLTQ